MTMHDNGLFSKIWFLLEYVRDYTILFCNIYDKYMPIVGAEKLKLTHKNVKVWVLYGHQYSNLKHDMFLQCIHKILKRFLQN